jgi:DNA replication protein DnaC
VSNSCLSSEVVVGEAVVATATLHRLLHHSHVITIRGESPSGS